MGLKQDLIDAKVNALKESLQESIEMDTGPGSLIEREAEYTKEAIVKFLTEAEFTIAFPGPPLTTNSVCSAFPHSQFPICTKTILSSAANSI